MTTALASEEKIIAIVPIKGHNQIHTEALASSPHLRTSAEGDFELAA